MTEAISLGQGENSTEAKTAQLQTLASFIS